MALLFSNDLPEVVHDDECDEKKDNVDKDDFKTACKSCGNLVTFADDTTGTVFDKDPDEVERKLLENLQNASG